MTLSPVHYIEEDHGFSTPCWIWQRARDRHGYGVMWVRAGRRTRRSHRVYFETARGAVDGNLDLDHLCRVRACVNPDHLEPATRAVNAQRGARSKLTATDVLEIRSSSRSHRDLAREYGVSKSAIGAVKSGETWRNVREAA